MRFSQRIGIRPVKKIVQIDSIDDDLRNKLWNVFVLAVLEKLETDLLDKFFSLLWMDFFSRPIDGLNLRKHKAVMEIKERFISSEWYEVYDFVEFVAHFYSNYVHPKAFTEACNYYLEIEKSAYRFINDNLTKITDEVELKEIEETIELAENNKLEGVKQHIQTALQFLSDRKNPNYRNSIKESISAVETACRMVTGEKSDTLGKAINSIKKKNTTIHQALLDGFSSLYGYTCDEGGIRHSMMDKTNLDYDDAKFMLVACCAFTNYLIAKCL